ncbi:rhodanese-like domain-containing protein [Flavihumibacter profundi]|jgi:phage shock protein E|uniref:rhodanese-like domain-containing protein n=1 Tax=Flavihumibacter profundi TaxID=2716883 RepID=UPI001CC5DC18|nr:rhodanese-like domain-containing protein [Flavihumibacter profundi]MBZ5855609.1 rhodanese-like domain-containing protein [Flavihumibacter profundi]
MNIFQSLFGGETADLKSIIEKGAFLVDVRTPAEFAGGSVPGAVNIPLDTIGSQLAKFKGKENIVVFCRSGNRSGQAKSILMQNGFTNVINGGTVDDVIRFVH